MASSKDCTAGMNLACNAALAAGLPVSAPGQTMDRQCTSGLMAVATAAKRVMVDGMQVVVAGGRENIAAEQKNYFEGVIAAKDAALEACVPHAYTPMLQTAEFVAHKYRVARDAQDLYSFKSRQRSALAWQQGRFDREIVPITAQMAVADKATGAISYREVWSCRATRATAPRRHWKASARAGKERSSKLTTRKYFDKLFFS